MSLTRGILTVAFMIPASATAQLPREPAIRSGLFTASGAKSEASGIAALAVNMALGGITAGALRAGKGQSMWKGVGRGSLAGAAVFAGKRLVAEETPWSWWTGRQLAAIGSSEVMNAARRRPVLAHTALPLGPVRIHVERTPRLRARLKLDLATSASALVVARRANTNFAWKESVSSGSLVFLTETIDGGVGSHSAGVIRITDYLPDGDFAGLERKRAVLSHEVIHAVQYDFLSIAWGTSLEDAIARYVPRGKRLRRYVDFGVLSPVHAGLNSLMPREHRPWEAEATALSAGR